MGSAEIPSGIAVSRTSTPFSRKLPVSRLPMTGKEVGDPNVKERPATMVEGGERGGEFSSHISRTRVSVSAGPRQRVPARHYGNCGHCLSPSRLTVHLRHEMHEFCGEFDSLYAYMYIYRVGLCSWVAPFRARVITNLHIHGKNSLVCVYAVFVPRLH